MDTISTLHQLSEHADRTDTIEDPKFEKLLASLGREYLGKPVQFEESRKPAKGILTYIGPSLVLNGRFVPPNDFFIPEQQLEVMNRKTFPDEGCRLERLIFGPNDDFIVLLVNATDTPTEEDILKCFLGAVLTALGEELDGTPIQTVAEMDQQIRRILTENGMTMNETPANR